MVRGPILQRQKTTEKLTAGRVCRAGQLWMERAFWEKQTVMPMPRKGACNWRPLGLVTGQGGFSVRLCEMPGH